MGGNKHKNGIVCVYPGCEKTMRTQKFKLHFTKQHLKPGEVYNVEHRRRFEVARDEEYVSDTSSPHPLEQHLPITAQIPTNYQSQVAAAVAAATAAAAGSTPVIAPIASPDATTASANGEGGDAITPAQTDVGAHPEIRHNSNTNMEPLSQQRVARSNPHQPRSADGRFGYNGTAKRPASAIEPARADTAVNGTGQQVGDPSRAVLVEYIEMMDQRFHELIQKMGQVIDGQRELIDMLRRPFPAETAQLLEQTPSLSQVQSQQQTHAPSPSQSSSPTENLTGDSSAKKRRKSNSNADPQPQMQQQQQTNGTTTTALL